jgi:hypothetical protein
MGGWQPHFADGVESAAGHATVPDGSLILWSRVRKGVLLEIVVVSMSE